MRGSITSFFWASENGGSGRIHVTLTNRAMQQPTFSQDGKTLLQMTLQWKVVNGKILHCAAHTGQCLWLLKVEDDLGSTSLAGVGLFGPFQP